MRYVLFLTGILIILSIFSCNEYNIGSGILPQGDFAQIVTTDTVTIKLYTEKAPKLATYSPNDLIIGKYNDPIFGMTEASFMTQLYQTKYPEWGDSATFDSIVLCLPLEQHYYYGSENQMPNVTVYKVTDTLHNKVYYNNEKPSDYTDFTILGTGTMYIWYPTDSSESTTPTLRMRLNDELGQDFIENSDNYFFSPGAFYNIFKGIYVKCNNTPGLYKIKTDNSDKTNNFGIVIYFHYNSTPDTVRRYTLPLISRAVKFNMFTHEYSGTALDTILNSDVAILSNKVYLQSMGGTVVRFSAPGLRKLKNIVINKALLVIQTENSNFSPIPEIWLAVYDSTKQAAYLNDYLDANNQYQGFKYENGQYIINVTRVMQNYIDSVYYKQGLELYLYDMNAKSDFERSIILNGTNQGPKTKLILTYTKIQ